MSTPPRLHLPVGPVERSVSPIIELGVNVLKVLAVAALVLGFIFDISGVMYFGLVVGISAFALHFSSRPVPDENWVARVLRFFWPSPERPVAGTPHARQSPQVNRQPHRRLSRTPQQFTPLLPVIVGSPAIGPTTGSEAEVDSFHLLQDSRTFETPPSATARFLAYPLGRSRSSDVLKFPAEAQKKALFQGRTGQPV